MAEKNDYQALKRSVIVPGDRIDRVENVLVPGMPDVNYCIDGREGWLELKSPTEPKRATTKLFASNHKTSQDQMNWFLRQKQAGGSADFLIATDKRWMLLDGSYADAINDQTVADLIVLSLWRAIKPIKDKNQWKILRGLLKR